MGRFKPNFLLVGNAPFLNRGCEAIVRGTTHILDETFGTDTRYFAASFGDPRTIQEQGKVEALPRLRHEAITPKGRFCLDYAKFQLSRFCGINLPHSMYHLPFPKTAVTAALQVGGDNYSLDYGYPTSFMQLDSLILQRRIPLVLWGASVGPFSADPTFERRMVNHLRKFSLILARETRTLTYLKNLGLENLALVADPAFLLKPEPLPGFSVPANTVGVNLSPLTSWRGTDGDLEKWCIICAKFVEKLQARFNNILLIPHVASPQPFNDDPTFLAQVYSALSCKNGVTLLEQFPSAGSLKWIISQCELFIGARTHATIAALSTGVPTLSLAYSQKAWGLNQDIFGHTDYCYDVRELEAEERVDRAVTLFCKQRDAIREILVKTIPLHKKRASSAGTLLRQSLNK